VNGSFQKNPEPFRLKKHTAHEQNIPAQLKKQPAHFSAVKLGIKRQSTSIPFYGDEVDCPDGNKQITPDIENQRVALGLTSSLRCLENSILFLFNKASNLLKQFSPLNCSFIV
jgi:hypothetical protein